MTLTDEVIAKIQALPAEGQQRVLDFISTLSPPKSAEHSDGAPDQGTIWERLSSLGRSVEKLSTDLPDDLAKNHDHYLHGMPKRP